MNFEFLKVVHEGKVVEVSLARAEKANALNEKLWREVGEVFGWADTTPEVRCVILRGEGPHFCSGIDLEFVGGVLTGMRSLAEGHRQEALRQFIKGLQQAFTAVESCRKPVIAAVHGVCFGGGVDLITACDIRHASKDASFSVKEVDLGIVADVGTLQRLPHLVGQGRARELALTGRTFSAEDAAAMGLVTQLAGDSDGLLEGAREHARLIAGKSPLAVRGIKQVMNFSRDHSVADSLEYVATWNAGMLLSADMEIAMKARLAKKTPSFSD